MVKKRGKSKEKKGNAGFWKSNYRETWQYVVESKNYIWGAFWVFLLFSVLGFIFPVFFVDQIQEFVMELLEMTKDLNAWQMILFLFRNNLWSAFSGILLGIVFGVVPALSTILNGYVLGFVSSAVVAEAGYISLWRLLPHGIFEIPAVMISLGLGIKLGMFMFARKPIYEFKRRLLMSMKVFLLIVIPLLVVAAIIEGALIIYLA